MKPSSAGSPSFIEPMKALPVEKLPEGDWLYEVKHDGYRALAFKDGKDVRLVSRNKKAFDYPQLLNALKLLPADRVILDGEIVALDEKGRSSFQLLQDYKRSEQRVPLVYYVFDLLFVDGKDLRKEPLSARRKLLADILKKAPPNIRLSEGLQASKEDLLRVAQEFGLEGLVAKRLNSIYESGRRTGAWVKFKITKSQEFVVGGYTLPEGGRKYFGSLLVGYQGPEGLLFAGRVGTGFSDKALANLYAKFQKIRASSCPFVNLPEKSRGRWGQGISPAVMKRCQWVKPVLVAQIKFTEWTLDNQLRQPIFLGLRTDKDPKDVGRELTGFAIDAMNDQKWL
jgi:bifunctional non-homologous end joining protein LigD